MSKHFVPLKKKTTSSQEIKTYTLEVKIMRRRERDKESERERERMEELGRELCTLGESNKGKLDSQIEPEVRLTQQAIWVNRKDSSGLKYNRLFGFFGTFHDSIFLMFKMYILSISKNGIPDDIQS